MSDKKTMESLTTLFGQLGGLAGILSAIGYLSERFHNSVLGVELAIPPGDFLYRGGMFFFNTVFAMPFALYTASLMEWLLLASACLLLLAIIALGNSKKFSAHQSLWTLMAVFVFLEGILILNEYKSLLPGKNMLLLGKNPYKLGGYGRLALLTTLHGMAYWQLLSWRRATNTPSRAARPLLALAGMLLFLQVLSIPPFYGGLSHPNTYPIITLNWKNGGDATARVAVLGEYQEMLVTYHLPTKKILLIDKDKVGGMEAHGVQDIFDEKNYQD